MSQFITSLKVYNFMCFTDKDLIPTSTHPHVFHGESENGKTASMLALLLGLGYDVGLPNYTPGVLCGCDLSEGWIGNYSIVLVLLFMQYNIF